MDLNSNDILTQSIRGLGINTWDDLKAFTRLLPYGRNANRKDLSLVISESKGTCCSKHAMLKLVANLNKVPNIELMLCLYKMNLVNTPGIGIHLKKSNLEYIPEAHCYLLDDGVNLDLTNKDSSFNKIKDSVIEKISIEPHEVSEFKVNYHKDYLMRWIVMEQLPLSFDQLWKLREICIANLSNKA